MRRALVALALVSCAAGDDARRTHAPGPSAPAARTSQRAAAEAPMIVVPGGRFVRGREGGRTDERPAHEVEVTAFEIDSTLVTRAAFGHFVEATGWVTSAERAGFGVGASEGMEDWAWERIPEGSPRNFPPIVGVSAA